MAGWSGAELSQTACPIGICSARNFLRNTAVGLSMLRRDGASNMSEVPNDAELHQRVSRRSISSQRRGSCRRVLHRPPRVQARAPTPPGVRQRFARRARAAVERAGCVGVACAAERRATAARVGGTASSCASRIFRLASNGSRRRDSSSATKWRSARAANRSRCRTRTATRSSCSSRRSDLWWPMAVA